ncbi:calcium-binding protein [Mesorhizobium sp. CO1-1-11]|uniref:calcium-binding protein n=1 Tax=Mesorhizobium sp. CO1-1-11 TaxID=2876636 RepID=UPI001CC98286|nr:calcium-binding protein [Mesorhizobium sp. CO1-1-11]MBZ9725294.1 calcium-binding protein [Mesorhizobium sp. CO1-1-11]
MRERISLYLGIAITVSGCGADYLNNYDTVTLAAGDANRSNMLLQTVDPFNPNSQNTHIEGDGQRSAGVIQRYRGVPPPAAASGQDPNSRVDLDCAGGKGNNPVVQGPVAVGPSDPNGLDRNHNGIGCEG